MPGQDLIDRMAAAYVAYHEGDAEPFFELIADHGVLRHVAPVVAFPFATPRRGAEGAKEMIGQILTDFQWLNFRAFELIAEDDLLVALTGGRLRHRASGREAAIHLADMIRFADGRIVEFVEFFDTAGLHDWAAGQRLPGVTLMNPGNRLLSCDPGEATRNKTLISDAFTAYSQGDPGLLAGLFAEDACYNSVASLEDFRFAGPCHGKAAVLENLGRIAEDYALERYDLQHLIAQRDLVVGYADAAFRCKATGKLAEVEKLDIFRLYDGRIVEFNEFFDSLTTRRSHELG